MATGYEVAMYRHIEIIAEQSRAQTKALESIAETLAAIAGGLAAVTEAIFAANGVTPENSINETGEQ
jgi:hypothetical protein